jgi:hypothetical protein
MMNIAAVPRAAKTAANLAVQTQSQKILCTAKRGSGFHSDLRAVAHNVQAPILIVPAVDSNTAAFGNVERFDFADLAE